MMNTDYRKSLPGTDLDYFDTRAAVEAIEPGAYARLPYVSRVLAELEADARDSALAAAREALSAFVTDEGVQLDAACWLVSARG